MSVLGFRLSGARVILLAGTSAGPDGAPAARSSGSAAPASRWGPAANEAVADHSVPAQGMSVVPAIH
jgi:hypothetical protein